MILSSQSTFGDRFSFTLPTNTSSSSRALPNEIDLGEPMIPVHGKKAIGRSIGGGTPLPFFFAVNEIGNNTRIAIWFNVLTSHDNSHWERMFQFKMKPHTTGNQVSPGDVAGARYIILGMRRYIRVEVQFQPIATPAANSKLVVTAALGTFAGTSANVFK